MRFVFFACLAFLVCSAAGCGNFVARRMVQAPNTYPHWLAPSPRVQLVFRENFITNFPARFVEVGPPPVRLRYRVVNPADYDCVATSTNWLRRSRQYHRFTFSATVPGVTNSWTANPQGTVVLLHGYGVGAFAMSPWAVRLAQEGWRCVTPDLRGHGGSTGRRIFYGTKEVNDLRQLLDELDRNGKLAQPVHVVGDSYGATLALRWKIEDPRIDRIVSISPYAYLSNAVLNISHDYAKWLPQSMLRSGIKRLPELLEVQPDTLDTVSLLQKSPVKALFIAGELDEITTVADVQQVCNAAATGSRLLVIPKATHEALPYYFDDLVHPVLNWLANETLSSHGAKSRLEFELLTR